VLAFLAALLAGCGAEGPAAPSSSESPTAGPDRSLAESLRHGGYVIYFRHAQTDRSATDEAEDPEWWRSRDPQEMRQLSAEGRDEAREVGEALRDLGVPVDAVLSSEYWRAEETARLLGAGSVETTPGLNLLRWAETEGGEDGRQRTRAELRRLLSAPPPETTNTVLVGHRENLMEAADVSLEEGEAAVFEPLGGGGFRLVTIVSPEDWTALARDSR